MKVINKNRAEKEKLRIDFEQQDRNSKRQIAEQIANAKSFQSEKETLQSKVYISTWDSLNVQGFYIGRGNQNIITTN